MAKEDIVELANRVNNLIAKRTEYGERYENGPGQLLSWSNGSAHWLWSGKAEKGSVYLDANWILVPHTTRKAIEELLSADLLEPLPLYGGSWKRRKKGTPDYTGIELPPMIRIVRDGDYPREQAVDDALLRKAQEN